MSREETARPPGGNRVSLIAAIAADRVIGNHGALPWRLPDDLARFKRLTMGHPVAMGHATFQSMGRPLPGRRNIVLTRDRAAVIPGCETAHSLKEALELGAGQELFVIGGAAVYALFLPVADLMYLTLIDAAVPGDTFFPEVPWEQWRVRSEILCPPDPLHPLPHRFVDYERTEGGSSAEEVRPAIPGLQFPGAR
jgi:dihydrofolate reductase